MKPGATSKFLTEAKAAPALNRPHVCVVDDMGETNDGLPITFKSIHRGFKPAKYPGGGSSTAARATDSIVIAAKAAP